MMPSATSVVERRLPLTTKNSTADLLLASAKMLAFSTRLLGSASSDSDVAGGVEGGEAAGSQFSVPIRRGAGVSVLSAATAAGRARAS